MSVKLSHRLKVIADLVPRGSYLSDIGCDHALIPIYLATEGRIKGAIAADIKEGPLQIARDAVDAEGLSGVIRVRQSDGFKSIDPGECDTAVIAGMGGLLMERILREGDNTVRSLKTLVLSPQSDVEAVRRYMCRIFVLSHEEMVKDEGKYYVVMKYESGAPFWEYSDTQYRYGPLLIREGSEVFLEYLKRKKEEYQGILKGLKNSKNAPERRAQIEKEISLVNEAVNMAGKAGGNED